MRVLSTYFMKTIKSRSSQYAFSSTSHQSTELPSVPIQQVILPNNNSTVAFTREGDLDLNLVFVALHGGPGSHKDFKYLSQSILKTVKIPHQFIRFDLPGYAMSTRPGNSIPSSATYAESIVEVLRSLDLIPKSTSSSSFGKNKILTNKKIVMIGHSLGGHIAVELSSRVNLSALVLLASVACRPHNALMNERGFPYVKWLGLNVYTPIIGPIIRWYLDLLYKKFFKFPKSSKKDEIAWTQARVAHLDWNRFNTQISELQTCPTLLAYALNDHLIQRERFEELENMLKKAGGIKNFAIYSEGGHNIQKGHADDIASKVALLLDQIDTQVIS